MGCDPLPAAPMIFCHIDHRLPYNMYQRAENKLLHSIVSVPQAESGSEVPIGSVLCHRSFTVHTLIIISIVIIRIDHHIILCDPFIIHSIDPLLSYGSWTVHYDIL